MPASSSDSSSADPTSLDPEAPFSDTDASADPAVDDDSAGEKERDGEDESAPESDASRSSNSEGRLSKVTIGVHFATNRRGQLRARLLRSGDGTDKTDLSELTEGFSDEAVVVRGRIQTHLDLNALFAEGLFADRSLDEEELRRRKVESVNRMQREDATPLQDGTPIGEEEEVYDLSTDPSDEPPLPDAVRVAIPFVTDHSGAVCARLDLDETLHDTTELDTIEDEFSGGKALVRGKIRAEVDLEALFSARIVEGAVDPGTMYMPPTS